MIVFPAAAAVLALVCAAQVGWGAWKRPRPERVIWTVAFLVFAIAAGVEVGGSAIGWSSAFARLYYITGAVLVVGILALGELYLLFPSRMPKLVPGFAMLVAAVAVTIVWSAPVDTALLSTRGWGAIERGPLLIALTATINAGGTLVLVAGALYSAWKIRKSGGSSQQALGCVFIAVGTIVVAAGGTLTRFGYREYLYLAMALGIAIIFAGVVLTSRTRVATASAGLALRSSGEDIGLARRARLIPLPAGPGRSAAHGLETEGIRFVVSSLLPLDNLRIAEACQRWSATPWDAPTLSRERAHQVWALRVALPEESRGRFDRLSLSAQAQLAELYAEIWSRSPGRARGEHHA